MNLAEQYRAYIACLNERRWQDLGNFVDDGVHYNGERISLAGYQAMLENDVRIIPDLRFNIDLLVVEAPQIAARLLFNCSPQGRFLGLEARGQRITFSENVFYTFGDGKIIGVWSVIDKAAVERELRGEAAGASSDRST
ncbi:MULTISPECIES: ester cyclase [Pseudomonas syringae group]|uniref:Ester cyclase n=1 Tax=Pseudomonas syringae Cit 7 TaxID=629264 RepID=A0A8T8M070_PSESX|nr:MULTISPECIES: ester cyclase [Pseudomonas syringae group]MBC9742012.1 ester cyclase [Pseudomonas syringae pv. syringae]MBC9746133.1 ester cyclase [Pseudomonas syringae pv. syringae]MCH5651982.1 ester cyclase [Pseudomonas syringae]MCK9695125.1 ester cyclase [Pseudomonas syringae pv. syringae]MCK9715502.1 ester cyclase [Pseudomonas syringae pv. syringae]